MCCIKLKEIAKVIAMLNLKTHNMKNVLIIFILLGSFAITAQNKPIGKKESRQEMKSNFTPEQRAELLSKKMTLELNLTDLQQKQVKQLFLNTEKDRPDSSKNRREMTSEEKFAMKNNQMDRRIALKRGFKEILNKEQFEKWEKGLNEKRPHHSKYSRQNKRDRQ